MPNRDDFSKPIIESTQKRAAFICSNPDCLCLTIAPSENDDLSFLYVGSVAHITAASKGGPRYDSTLTSEQRTLVSNAIFLCSNCATMIDKNSGEDYTVELLNKWKEEHEAWVRGNLNMKPITITEIDGTHEAHGIGDVVGLRVTKSVKIKTGTISRASGIGKISGTSIEQEKFMNSSGAGFGFRCPNCNITIDVIATLGSDPQCCPQCGRNMIPNPQTKISAKAICKKCNSFFGLINSDKCPNCGELFE